MTETKVAPDTDSDASAPPRERPMLFSAPMVRAILEGRKSVTRRAIKPQPPFGVSACHYSSTGWALEDSHGGCCCTSELRCPYGQPGDRLWVKETWAPVRGSTSYEYGEHSVYEWDEDERGPIAKDAYELELYYRADGEDALPAEFSMSGGSEIRWRSPLFMPRWASRITLEVTGVRVERLQDISKEDAKAEGLEHSPIINVWRWSGPDGCGGSSDPRHAFRMLWTSINGAGSWAVNPWVWVVAFKRVTP